MLQLDTIMDVVGDGQPLPASTPNEPDSQPRAAQKLTENDIDGASLSGRQPNQLTNKELKFWLTCRGQQCTKLKTKAQLIAR